MKASDLTVGDYVRSPRGHKKIYKVTQKMDPTSVLIRRYDTKTKEVIENDFMFLKWQQEVERVTI